MFTSTASIGNAVLKSSLYLRENYSVTETVTTLNMKKSGCYQCSVFLNENECNSFNCGNCSLCTCNHKVYDTSQHKIYVNEKNRYGERYLLKKNAILLFIYLHFLNPDKYGMVYVDIEDAANELGCTERTIQNNLKLLHKHHYITMPSNPIFPGYYNMFLSEYTTYFKKAEEGGRGYSVFTHDVFKKLVKLPDLNSLRLAIRNIIPETQPKAATDRRLSRSYQEIKRDLPTYCSKKTIRSITDHKCFKELFYVNHKKRFMTLNIKDEFNPLHTADFLKSDCKNQLVELLKSINQKAEDTGIRYKLHLTPVQLDDISSISLKIAIPYILSAVKEVYVEYISHNRRIDSIGALVRTIAEYKSSFSLTA